jgi:imidazolonepropionase-like amidohydrolase
MAVRLCFLLAAASMSPPSRAQPVSAPLGPYLKEQGTTFLLVNARLIDGTGTPAREKISILANGARIIRVAKTIDAPAGAKRIDLAGHTVLPGLVMMHEHINYFSGAAVWNAMPGSVPKLLLAAGVTTARTAGAEAPQVDLNLKKRIDAGRVPGPRLFVTGAYLNGASGDFLGDTVVSTADEAAAVTDYWGVRGATSVKVYSAISPQVLAGAVAAARRRGMHVAGHLGEIGCSEAVEAGIHTIEHSLTSCAKDLGVAPDAIGRFRYDPASEKTKRLVALLVARNVVMVATPPTTGPLERSEEELEMLSPHQRARYDEIVRNRPPWLPSPSDAAVWDRAHRDFERHFVASGGRLLVGADASDLGAVPGYANHSSITALVRAGFSPLEVIRMATRDAAEFLGEGERIGTVAPGKVADLLIVRGAPDKTIEDIRQVVFVFKDGRVYDPEKLRAAARGKLGLQ